MRNLTPAMAAELSASSVQAVILAEMYFDSGFIGIWGGYGTLTWGEKQYIGAGNLLNISSIDETQDLQAKGIVATLNGIPGTLIALALTERSRGRKFRAYLASVSSQSYVATEDEPGRVMLEDGSGYVRLENNLVDSPYRIFAGFMDTMEFSDNGQDAIIRLAVENILIIGQRNKVSRYTPEDQRKLYPNDKGLELINQLQDKEVIW